VLESPVPEEVVEHTVDGVANDGATYVFEKPIQKIQNPTSLPLAGMGFTAVMWRFYSVEKNFFNKKSVTRRSGGNFFVANDLSAAAHAVNNFHDGRAKFFGVVASDFLRAHQVRLD